MRRVAIVSSFALAASGLVACSSASKPPNCDSLVGKPASAWFGKACELPDGKDTLTFYRSGVVCGIGDHAPIFGQWGPYFGRSDGMLLKAKTADSAQDPRAEAMYTTCNNAGS